MPPALPALLQAALVAVVLVAGVWDLATRRIPNWITVPGAALGLAIQSYYGGLHGAVSSLLGALLGFSFFLLLYLAGGMGAGDVKLAAAVGALVGAQSFVFVFVVTGLLGGIVAVVLALARGRLRQTLDRTASLLLDFGRWRWSAVRTASDLDAPGALRLPYGAVIAGGALAFVAWIH
jgi:prepilin peptidase CpaA